MTESQVQSQILEYLLRSGIFAWRNNTMGVFDQSTNTYRRPGRFAINGVSDVLGILPDGRFLAIEVKKPVKNPRTDEKLLGLASDVQRAFINRINRDGGLAFVADSLDVVKRRLAA